MSATFPRVRAACAAVVAVAVVAAVAAGCRDPAAGDGGSEATSRPLVELFSWWTAPGEAEAMEALVDVHRQLDPDARIFNAAAANGTKARFVLDERLLQGDPPDLFQEYVHDLRATLRHAGGRQQSLDDLVARLGLRDVIFPEILGHVTEGGHVVAMPVNIHRENGLFFNKHVFAAHRIEPPQTLDELLEACRRLKAEGVTPIATAHQGWILRIMFNTIAMGSMGSTRYQAYFSGAAPVDVAQLRAAIHVFGTVLEKYTNEDAGDEGFGWTSAAQAVYNGDAAMFLHGDWVKGYFVQLGWDPEEDFGVVPAPGAQDLFLYGVDAFALPVGAQNSAGARAFLATVASIPGQVAFNRLKGSTPIRRDAPPAALDSIGRATYADFFNARIRMFVHSRPTWEDALTSFAHTHDEQTLLQFFLSSPPGK